jgi:hypothetical protein
VGDIYQIVFQASRELNRKLHDRRLKVVVELVTRARSLAFALFWPCTPPESHNGKASASIMARLHQPTTVRQISLGLHEVLSSPSKYVFMIRHTNAEYALSPAAPPDLATVKETPDPIVLNHASMNAKIRRFCPNDASRECQLPPYAQSVVQGSLILNHPPSTGDHRTSSRVFNRVIITQDYSHW